MHLPSGGPPRSNAAPIKVVGLGLGRTGTMSLWAALNTLGLGPCYHPMKAPPSQNDWEKWADIIEGQDSPESFDIVLAGYQSVVDSPVAVKALQIYMAYPDAKFILTTRDPIKWEKSMRATVLAAYDILGQSEVEVAPHLRSALRWSETYLDVYHGGRLPYHPQEELLAHNERIKSIIPPNQLLVYEMGEGWDRLVKFLGVEKPTEGFPHLNDTAWYEEKVIRPVQKLVGQANVSDSI